MLNKPKTYSFSLILVAFIILFSTACSKENLDESDPNVYQWELVYYRYPMLANSTTGAPEFNFSERMVEYKREILSLTNKEVNAIKNRASKDDTIRIDIKKI